MQRYDFGLMDHPIYRENGDWCRYSDAEQAIADAVKAERERCARVCEDLIQEFQRCETSPSYTLTMAADKIRKGE